ncbi:hypothetical protein SU69_01135 [Thermosipho melanesiensis]|uniref:Uncharacterized protein n=2 Tax=Thermosipho melanesiensis TaxID=46541 RepID=A6LJI5_THEM4|nr:NusG domain II-containing protein [Thermosipho melanesiensis]ABR30086.1 protein of unknown function DUF1312 [Thermosipho melanesiensis BI429]APT73283.1 hypothetical protein BW47_01175 [Thermosipho melanesiensis]OOC38676.1 hypothetical protein SU68_01135 [Thermosipho melanesiensis]OOC40480.1 hypothetical protein SU70_01135 [Thermosipho melanesiensis]OOC40745.1 hypothetical protein SU69_01135 [Thermosipho melanesiensis]
MKTTKKSDLFLIVLILIVILILFPKEDKNAKFVVKVDGKVYLTLEEPGSYEIKNNNKILTIVHFDGKNVWVTDSTCPLKICEKTGKITKGGKIICIPNKIVIESQEQELQTW